MLRRGWIAGGLLAAALTLGACADSSSSSNNTTEATDDGPVFIDLTTGQNADLVIGQGDYTSNTIDRVGDTNADADTAHAPVGRATFANSTLFLVDTGNHRVLGFDTVPDSLDIGADFFLGQTGATGETANQGGSAAANTLDTPSSAHSDGEKLVIADTGNNRVVIFNSIPTTSDASANVAVGQTALNVDPLPACNGTRMQGPASAVIVDDKLIVADTSWNRVLIWDPVPTTSGEAADLVLGQADMSSCTANRGGSVAANTLSSPRGVASDGDWLLVADRGNHRVLIWTSFPTSDGEAADIVIGQPNMTSATNGIDDATMDSPADVSYTGLQVFVADRGNARVLIFNDLPASNGVAADVVIGQPDFDTNSTGTTQSKFAVTQGVTAIDSQLFVSDTGNNRFLIFDSN